METHLDNKKFYVPQIEEFRVGFEYELKWKNEDWIKEVLSEASNLIRIRDIINQQSEFQIRVKYLDKQDIEDLGFTETNYLKNTDYTITFEKQHKDGKAEITYWHSIHYIEIYTAEDVDTQFQGYCKNKSELITLLKQLNIQ